MTGAREPPFAGGNRKRRPGFSLFTKLALAFVLFAFAAALVTALLTDYAARRGFDSAVRTKIGETAAVSASLVRVDGIETLQEGDTDSRVRARIVSQLAAMKEKARLNDVFLLDEDNRVLAEASGTLPVGAGRSLANLDLAELRGARAGSTAVSPVYRDREGRPYVTAYSPVMDRNESVAAVLGVEASADYFRELGAVRRTMLVSGAAGLVVAAAAGIILAFGIVRPVRRLTSAAAEFARGNFDHRITVRSGDELGILADAVSGMARDIKERDAKLRSVAEVGEIAAQVAHEIRNPINGISLLAGLLRRQMGERPPEVLDRISAEIDALNARVGEFLKLARPVSLRRVPLDASAVADSAIELAAVPPEVKVSKNHAGKPLRISADPEQLRGALLNLVINAVQSMEGRGGMDIGTDVVERDGRKFAAFTVKDSGPGIPAEIADRIFEPFFTTRREGTGMGLAVARKVATAHGGRCELASTGPDGSVFALLIPVQEEE